MNFILLEMIEKEILLLKKQINKLDEKNFDLDVWKNYTLLLLERIFGEGDTRIRLVKELHYDYSSWNLRDATGVGKTFDPVKMQAREILGAVITELEVTGIPGRRIKKSETLRIVEEELTGRQMKELESVIQGEEAEKVQKIEKILATLDKEKLVSLIAKLLLA